MKFQDIKHFFTVTPDLLQVKGFADGVEGGLKLSWQHPIPNPDPDSDEPAEGTNHLRIEVNTEWLPFYPRKTPKAKKDWCLLIRFGGIYNNNRIIAFTFDEGKWTDWDNGKINEWTFNCAQPLQYKLVPLPQQ